MSTATKSRPKYRALSDEERAAKRAAEADLVAASVAQLTSSEGWQAWLATRSRFHKYSFGNQLLIALQDDKATRVAGFHKWLELGYCVRKGEHGIRIWAPCPPSKSALARAAAAGEDRPRTFFRLTAVFAQHQVDPLPPPAVPVPLEPPRVDIAGDDLADRLPGLIAFANSIGSDVTLGADTGRAGGYYRPETREIVIGRAASPNAEIRVLVHELAHALVRADRQDGDPDLNYASEELIAESVAYSVMGTLGIDAGGSSFAYLASWGAKADIGVIKSAGALVHRLASRIEDAAEVVA